MKIDILNSSNSSLNGSQNVRASKTLSNTTQTQSSSTVQLSEQALEVSSNSEVFDSAKVEQIKTAIAEGRFQVNANAVADSLINTARDLIKNQSSVG